MLYRNQSIQIIHGSLIFNIYSMSPKLGRELANCATELEMRLDRIGCVLDVRWVASSCRSVRAVSRTYAAMQKINRCDT